MREAYLEAQHSREDENRRATAEPAAVRKQRRHEIRQQIGLPAMAVVFAALIGAGAGYFGAQEGARSSIVISREERQVQNDVRVADKRATVYKTFLDSAVQYSASANALDEQLKLIKRDPPGTNNKAFSFTMSDALRGTFSNYTTARSKYQSAINELYVYGSDRAWKSHVAMSRVLPPSLGDNLDLTSNPPDPDAFSLAYQEFQDVFCAEAVTQPRKGCGRR